MPKPNKTELVKARVSKAVKAAVTDYARTIGDSASGEAEAVVIREALGEYFTKRGIKLDDDKAVRIMRETISPKQAAKYSGSSRNRRRKRAVGSPKK